MVENQSLLQIREGNIATLILNRPERKNALCPELLMNLHEVLTQWARDPDIRVVVITGGEGPAFSSGYEVQELPAGLSNTTGESLGQGNPLEMALDSVVRFPFPTIAMINGFAFGAGLNLAMCCDIRIASATVSACMPPARLGLVYPAQGLRQFVEVIGIARTKEIFFSGHTYTGQEVLEMGLVDHLVPEEALRQATYSLAGEIAANAPLSLKGMKRILAMLTCSDSLSEEHREEADGLVYQSLSSRDLREGQKAFAEKRKPAFSGK